MKLFLCIAFYAILAINSAIAEQNKEFRERAEIYSRLIDCDYYKTDEYNYTHFVELKTLKDAKPTGYLVRVPVYVIGPRDAHIILSTTNTPNREQDFVYEILLGGWGNSKVVIRKRIQNYSLKELTFPSVISELRPLNVVTEISESGHINVFTDNKAEPIISTYDPNVLQVKYISFASYQGATVEFLYNCVSDKTSVVSGNAIVKEPASTPLNEISQIELDELVQKCETEETWELQYNKFHLLKDFKNSQADGYLFKLNFFVYGSKEVHVLLSSTEKPDIEKESAYEIVIGGWGNTRQVIRKTAEGEELFEKVQLKDLISEEQQTRVLIQMTNDGLIEVLVGDLQYKPIVSAQDTKPVPVKYASFASNEGSRVLFFYNCDDERAAASLKAPAPAHPLLAVASEHDEEILAKKCKHVHAWDDTYTPNIKLEAVKNSKPDGFIFQVAVHIKGVRDAHILLTPNGSLDPKDGYEIVIGGWGNTRTLIRKHGEVLAKVNEFNVLDEFQPIKVIAELTLSGELRLLTELNKSKPLIAVNDAQPIADINTLSFTAYYRDLDFYYGCSI